MMRRSYINQELVHWTARDKTNEEAFNILSTIVSERVLRLTYCPNYVSEEYKPESSMVCFTDIPLNQSRKHCAKFGKCGIAFKKKNMIEYGANPVFYTTAKHFDRIRNIATLLERMKDLEKDREWREGLERYSFEEEETLAMLEVTEFLQEYSYKNRDLNYPQREWRLTFNSLPFAGGDTLHLPGMASFYIRNEKSYGIFKFDPNDVEYLVVPFRFWKKALKLKRELGCSLKIYEFCVGL